MSDVVVNSRFRAADLFCGAGGAGMGLYRAGFDVEGWDIKAGLNYPFKRHIGNALDAYLTGFDFEGRIYGNGVYSATIRRYKDGWPLGGGKWAQIGIWCEDGAPRHDWRDFQNIKNDLVGPDWEAIELYPAESRLLDPSNYYMLWCAPSIKVGKFSGRSIMTPENCIAPQRGWER